jgi:hypothetical protein
MPATGKQVANIGLVVDYYATTDSDDDPSNSSDSDDSDSASD